MWNVEKVRALVADQNHAATFFCGGSRNSDRFIGVFDEVFVLEIDLDTLNRRLAARPENEWGGTASEGESFARLQHETKEGLPKNAIIIDATAPLSSVVDEFLKMPTDEFWNNVSIRVRSQLCNCRDFFGIFFSGTIFCSFYLSFYKRAFP